MGRGRRRVYERWIVTDATTRVKRKHSYVYTICGIVVCRVVRKTCASVGVVTSAITTTARAAGGIVKKQKTGRASHDHFITRSLPTAVVFIHGGR